MKKILILGKNGQIARRLYQLLSPIYEVISLDRDELDFQNLKNTYSIITQHAPDIIINACGYTSVDQAELEPEQTYLVNYEAVKTIVKSANDVGAWLIHYSSDYVFDGLKNSAYVESDPTNPLSIYGKSKNLADMHIEQSCRQFIILRISAIFDSTGHNFPSTILQLADEKESLTIIDDQFIVPTSALFVAEITKQIIPDLLNQQHKSTGLYHLSPLGGPISWHHFAKIILSEWAEMNKELKCSANNIHPISTAKYAQRAKRPQFSQLSHLKLQEVFGLSLAPWDKYFNIFLKEMAQK